MRACSRAIFVAFASLTLTAPARAAEPSVPPETAPPDPSPAPDRPWRVAEALPSPDWLYFALEHRTRYAHLFDAFRAGRPGDGGLLSLRTSLLGELRLSPLRIGAELLDSRAYLSNDVTAPNTGIVNAVSLLQAYVGLAVDDALAPGDRFDLKVGRLAFDIGSRRLTARNRFRNTINAFTGIDATYRGSGGASFRLFATMPIERRPSEPQAVKDNDVVFDRESPDVIFAGQHFESAAIGPRIRIEGYAFELHERDSVERPTRNRRLFTPGFRVRRERRPGSFDFELEAALQIGRSRATASPDDTEDLDHLASFQHAALGYSFDVPLSPRLLAQYDQASGDADPRDDSHQRFDTLFGARRFEYGPTGIYGAFARSNVRSPGLRVQLKPHPTLKGFFGWRAFWLASARDAWTTSGLRDPTGQSGTFLGNQIEARVRYDPLIGNLRLEAGFAHLFPGGFAEEAPGAHADADSTMVYTQAILKL